MAIFTVDSRQSSHLEFRNVIAIFLSAVIPGTLNHPSFAVTDFSHPKQIYVPPSKIERHHKIGTRLVTTKFHNIVQTNLELTKTLLLNPYNSAAAKALISLWQHQVLLAPTANSYIGLGKAYQLTGNLYLAQNAYLQAVRVDPYNPNLAAARQSFQLALIKNQAEPILQQAKMLDEQYSPIVALQYISQALHSNPYNPYLLIFEGLLYQKIGQVTYAQSVYTMAIQADPGNKLAIQALSNLSLTSTSPSFGLPTFLPQTPIVSDVSQLSNLLVAVRNSGFADKQRMQESEEATHQALEQAFSHCNKTNYDFGIDQILSSSSSEAALYAIGPTPIQLNSKSASKN